MEFKVTFVFFEYWFIVSIFIITIIIWNKCKKHVEQAILEKKHYSKLKLDSNEMKKNK